MRRPPPPTKLPVSITMPALIKLSIMLVIVDWTRPEALDSSAREQIPNLRIKLITNAILDSLTSFSFFSPFCSVGTANTPYIQ